jgi:hypothetical protein
MDEAVTFRDLRVSDPHASRQLAERVRQSALTWFPDHVETNGTGRRLVVGVAVWSNYDLRLLDLMNEAAKQPDLCVAVLNIDELGSQADIQRVFPGIGDVFQTPVVGYWAAGQLRETASGFAGRQLVGRLLGFDPQVVLQQTATAK